MSVILKMDACQAIQWLDAKNDNFNVKEIIKDYVSITPKQCTYLNSFKDLLRRWLTEGIGKRSFIALTRIIETARPFFSEGIKSTKAIE